MAFVGADEPRILDKILDVSLSEEEVSLSYSVKCRELRCWDV